MTPSFQEAPVQLLLGRVVLADDTPSSSSNETQYLVDATGFPHAMEGEAEYV